MSTVAAEDARHEALAAWRAAHDQAGYALALWRLSHDRDDYLRYRAAQDAEDAAQDDLATLAKAAA